MITLECDEAASHDGKKFTEVDFSGSVKSKNNADRREKKLQGKVSDLTKITHFLHGLWCRRVS